MPRTSKGIKPSIILKWSLLAGSLYFLGVSSAHMLGVKVPLLYIYYYAPSYAYQDRIISFLAFGWAVFLFTAFLDPVKNRDLVRASLYAGSAAIAGLSVVNGSTDFGALAEGLNPWIYWFQTIGLGVYLLWLIVFYRLTGRG